MRIFITVICYDVYKLLHEAMRRRRAFLYGVYNEILPVTDSKTTITPCFNIISSVCDNKQQKLKKTLNVTLVNFVFSRVQLKILKGGLLVLFWL